MSVPVLTFDQLITPLTPEQVKTKIYEILAILRAPTTNWKPGGVTRLMIAAFAIIASALSITISLIAKSAFLSTSEGAWRTLVARYVFGTERLAATFANGTILLTNAQGGSFTKQPGEIIVANQNGKTYRNTGMVVIPSGPGGTVTAPFAAEIAGTGANSGIGTVTTLVTTLTGVTITNAVPFIGRDDESDGSLYLRAMEKPQSLSPFGPRGAYDYFAKLAVRASDGSDIGINRTVVSPSSVYNTVTVTVATPSGAVSGDPADPATDLGAVFATLLVNALPSTAVLFCNTVSTATIDVDFTAYGTNAPANVHQSIVEAALTVWMSSEDMPIGGVSVPEQFIANAVLLDTMRDIISQAFVDAKYTRPTLVKIYNPTGNYIITAAQVPEPGLVRSLA
jgi:hypothetical protein